MGNIFGRWEGSDASLGAVLTGSHCDAIPLAGMYDGTLGVVGAIEALAALKRAVRCRCWRVPVVWSLGVCGALALCVCVWAGGGGPPVRRSRTHAPPAPHAFAHRLQGYQPQRALEVLMFTSEEPTRFALSCVGSRAMAGVLEAGVLDRKLDENGTSFLGVRVMGCLRGVCVWLCVCVCVALLAPAVPCVAHFAGRHAGA
jgi:ureidoglycolate amidohydrolase